MDNLRKDMELKLENERRQAMDQMRAEIEQIEKEEELKMERKLEQLKRELQMQSQGLGNEQEI